MRYVLWGLAAVLLLVIAQFAIHAARTDPRDASAITERELRVNTLQPGERVAEMVPALQRLGLDYFRARHGLLVLTDRRLLFLGLEPRDLLSSGEGPATFAERDFAIDTLVKLEPGRTFFWLSKAIVVTTPGGEFAYGIPSDEWPHAEALLADMSARHDALYAEGARQKKLREKAAAERHAAEVEARKPKYYTVERGDAISTIAARWNTTPEQLREWNHLPNNMIRAGDVLLVKPESGSPADSVVGR